VRGRPRVRQTRDLHVSNPFRHGAKGHLVERHPVPRRQNPAPQQRLVRCPSLRLELDLTVRRLLRRTGGVCRHGMPWDRRPCVATGRASQPARA
jgi:hypothetical protein